MPAAPPKRGCEITRKPVLETKGDILARKRIAYASKSDYRTDRIIINVMVTELCALTVASGVCRSDDRWPSGYHRSTDGIGRKT